MGLLADRAQTVLALEPDFAALRALGLIGLVAPIAPSTPACADACDFEVRAFAAADGIPEDPVTGSLNAALAQWLIGENLAPPSYRVAQGTRLQRTGRVYVQSREGAIWIGGDSQTCITGTVML
jgi:PhzF family phenazine biosynthesis protein